jgi:hypothetical protein
MKDLSQKKAKEVSKKLAKEIKDYYKKNAHLIICRKHQTTLLPEFGECPICLLKSGKYILIKKRSRDKLTEKISDWRKKISDWLDKSSIF